MILFHNFYSHGFQCGKSFPAPDFCWFDLRPVRQHSVKVDPEVSKTAHAYYGFSTEGDCWHCLSYCFVVEGALQGLSLAWIISDSWHHCDTFSSCSWTVRQRGERERERERGGEGGREGGRERERERQREREEREGERAGERGRKFLHLIQIPSRIFFQAGKGNEAYPHTLQAISRTWCPQLVLRTACSTKTRLLTSTVTSSLSLPYHHPHTCSCSRYTLSLPYHHSHTCSCSKYTLSLPYHHAHTCSCSRYTLSLPYHHPHTCSCSKYTLSLPYHHPHTCSCSKYTLSLPYHHPHTCSCSKYTLSLPYHYQHTCSCSRYTVITISPPTRL